LIRPLSPPYPQSGILFRRFSPPGLWKASVFIVIAFWLLFQAHASIAAVLAGRVVGVLDGDTLEVLTPDRQSYRVRVSGIDAPEKKQPYGRASKKLMSDLAFSKQITIHWSKRDRYGRIIGKVSRSGVDLGLVMVERGMAWHYKQYQRDQEPVDRMKYSRAEDAARSARRGLWADGTAVAPWDYRRERRGHRTSARLRAINHGPLVTRSN
jgi:Micrococcal nuclease (thermonuclease) homologs